MNRARGQRPYLFIAFVPRRHDPRTVWLAADNLHSGAAANLGGGIMFNAFAAVVICGVSLKGGIGSLPGVYAGVLLLSSITTTINLTGLPANFTQVILGLRVVAADRTYERR